MHLERLWLTPKFTASPMKLSHFDVIRASGDLLWPAGSVLYCRLTTDPRVHINHCLFDERDGFCRISRLSRHDTTINGLTIPKGTIIQMLIHTVHHDEDYWPNPDQFDPERWADHALIILVWTLKPQLWSTRLLLYHWGPTAPSELHCTEESPLRCQAHTVLRGSHCTIGVPLYHRGPTVLSESHCTAGLPLHYRGPTVLRSAHCAAGLTPFCLGLTVLLCSRYTELPVYRGVLAVLGRYPLYCQGPTVPPDSSCTAQLPTVVLGFHYAWGLSMIRSSKRNRPK